MILLFSALYLFWLNLESLITNTKNNNNGNTRKINVYMFVHVSSIFRLSIVKFGITELKLVLASVILNSIWMDIYRFMSVKLIESRALDKIYARNAIRMHSCAPYSQSVVRAVINVLLIFVVSHVRPPEWLFII